MSSSSEFAQEDLNDHLGWEDQVVEGDDVVESHGVKVYVDKQSAPTTREILLPVPPIFVTAVRR